MSTIDMASPGRVSRALGVPNADLMVGPMPDLPRKALAHVVAARFLAGYGGHTQAAYRRDLVDYFTWCDNIGVQVLDAGRSAIDVYARTLADPGPDEGGEAEYAEPVRRRPLSRATIARRLVTLTGFYRYAQSEDLITRNPVEHVRRPKTDRDSPTLGMDRDEARRMLEAADAHSPRARGLVTLLLHTGLRISEALGADVSDIETIRGHDVLTVVGKGGNRRHVVLNAAVREAIAPLQVDATGERRTTGPLFATRTGGRFARSHAFVLIRQVAADAGLPNAGKLSPHSLRHTFVTLAREAGVPLEDVQDAAGHADPRTTRRYDRGRHNLDRSPAHALSTFLARPETKA